MIYSVFNVFSKMVTPAYCLENYFTNSGT